MARNEIEKEACRNAHAHENKQRILHDFFVFIKNEWAGDNITYVGCNSCYRANDRKTKHYD